MKYTGSCKKCGFEFEFEMFGDVDEAIDRILNYHKKECSKCKNDNNES